MRVQAKLAAWHKHVYKKQSASSARDVRLYACLSDVDARQYIYIQAKLTAPIRPQQADAKGSIQMAPGSASNWNFSNIHNGPAVTSMEVCSEVEAE